jgi:hypothetical protein
MTRPVTSLNEFISKEVREKLESFGGHTIAHGRATRWHWSKSNSGDDAFEMFRGGADEVLAVRICRDRDRDVFYAQDNVETTLASGSLEHVLAELEIYFTRLHGEIPDSPA